MLPLVGIPATIVEFLKSYRQVFRKEGGFQHIILNPIDKGYIKLAVFEPMIISEIFNFFCHLTEDTTTLG